jgi:leucyl aminopeptidase
MNAGVLFSWKNMMYQYLVDTDSEKKALPIWTFARGQSVDHLPAPARNWLSATGAECSPGQVLTVPDAEGHLLGGILCISSPECQQSDPFVSANLATTLPAGTYAFSQPPQEAQLAVLGFLLGTYRFSRYKFKAPKEAHLVLPEGVDAKAAIRLAEGVCLARDLINTPANDMGPQEIENAVRALAEKHSASLNVITGDDLLTENLPMIHAVGRAHPRAPRLIDMIWGPADAPKVTLVGKGVSFDTGGLDIKPSSAMLLMKKDMGGAAVSLGLAHMIMDAGLNIRLRVLIPAVENSISGDAFRPGDILKSRKGLSVEIGNTDAEGRLVLADALALADKESPELLIDFATLTGAARVALGPEIVPFFTRDDSFAQRVMSHGAAQHDPVWRLPLWSGYEAMLNSPVADINNTGKGGHAGAITAALFLARFVENARTYAHFDVFGWNSSSRPGRPEGGEAHAIRAVFAYLQERFEDETGHPHTLPAAAHQ